MKTPRKVLSLLAAVATLIASQIIKAPIGGLDGDDDVTHNVHIVYAAGDGGNFMLQVLSPTNIFVSPNSDGLPIWTAVQVYHDAPGISLANVFPPLAVDGSHGKLYAVWTNALAVYLSVSTDRGANWSPSVLLRAGS